jgi:signal peptidase II
MQEHGVEPAVTTPRARPWWAPVAAVALVVTALDQVTKWWALNALDDRTIDLIWTLRLRLVFNTGSAFGLGSRYTPIIALVAVAVVLVLLRAGSTLRGRWPLLAVGLVVGGAVGNLLDRVFREGGGLLGGAVVDFIDFQWWPVFNVADIAICVGAVLLSLTASREAEARERR